MDPWTLSWDSTPWRVLLCGKGGRRKGWIFPCISICTTFMLIWFKYYIDPCRFYPDRIICGHYFANRWSWTRRVCTIPNNGQSPEMFGWTTIRISICTFIHWNDHTIKQISICIKWIWARVEYQQLSWEQRFNNMSKAWSIRWPI